MKRIVMGTVAVLAAAFAFAPAAGAAPGDGEYCYSTGTPCSTTWTADVAGEYGVVAQSWSVDRKDCVTTNGVTTCSWTNIAQGTGGGYAAPGSLASGETYRLTLTNGGGAIGSITGNGQI